MASGDAYEAYICIKAHGSTEVGEVGMFVEQPDLDYWCKTTNVIGDAREALWHICQQFVDEQEIRCPETIYQCDRVMENACEFIEKLCNIVGYHKDEED